MSTYILLYNKYHIVSNFHGKLFSQIHQNLAEPDISRAGHFMNEIFAAH